MTSFDFTTWCSDHGFKQTTMEQLSKNDLDNEEALKLATKADIDTLYLTLGQQELLSLAVQKFGKAESTEK